MKIRPMKKLAILTGTLLFTLCIKMPLMAQEMSGPSFKFEEIKHDFGDIQQGEKVTYIFKFINSGTESLVISNVLTTCGCTAPTWPKEPVKPNDKGEIKVMFNSTGKIGKQNKVITILSNSTNQKDRITIGANVMPKT